MTAQPIRVERIRHFVGDDLHNLIHATRSAIEDGIGFNWLTPPVPETLENYWKGVLLVPDRILIGAWLDGALCASAQLVKPGKSRETSYFAVTFKSQFVAPYARSHGLARAILEKAEHEASREGFSSIRLSVRDTQEAAIHLYQDSGYQRWGILPEYEFVGGQIVAGHFFHKKLAAATLIA